MQEKLGDLLTGKGESKLSLQRSRRAMRGEGVGGRGRGEGSGHGVDVGQGSMSGHEVKRQITGSLVIQKIVVR